MAEFDFAPRPPKQDDQADASPFAAGDPAQNKAKDQGPAAGGKFSQARTAARRNPGETQGMLAGLMSMATTMGMARSTNAHIDPISSPSGLLGMIKSSFGAKQEKSDDHSFNLDLSRSAVAGGAIGGMSTGIGMVGGPVQAASKRESTSNAMRAIGSMARATGGGLSAKMGVSGDATRKHMQWLDQGVRNIYKVDR